MRGQSRGALKSLYRVYFTVLIDVVYVHKTLRLVIKPYLNASNLLICTLILFVGPLISLISSCRPWVCAYDTLIRPHNSFNRHTLCMSSNPFYMFFNLFISPCRTIVCVHDKLIYPHSLLNRFNAIFVICVCLHSSYLSP